jgi:hypothetical protein
MTSRAPRSEGTRLVRRVQLKPHNPFDLIRLLARSQSDARKALGELVQNSLDAGARRVDLTWLNERGERVLRILDDGAGVFPDMEREAALARLAQTIGHSHKHALSPSQRHAQMVLGKYGIGLLGFWCVARTLEIRSRVGGGEVWVLTLEEDRPEAAVQKARSRSTAELPTFTELVLRGVKESVQRQVRPARLQAFLAGELRGQLLQREVEVRLADRVARGRAQKEFVVRPRQYLGRPLADLTVLEVPEHEDARLELYHVPADEGRQGVVALACGGTTVLDDLALVDPTDPGGARREPWASGRFEGVIDFPDLQVAPGTRRGFVPDDAALEFLLALEKLEHRLALTLAEEERKKAGERHEQVVREIRRAFAPVARHLPQYDLFDVRAGRADAQGALAAAGAGAALDGEGDGASQAGEVRESVEPQEREPTRLFPPGPLNALRARPARLRLAPGGERSVRATAVDADGRAVTDPVEFHWSLQGEGECIADGPLARYRAGNDACDALLEVRARQGRIEVGLQVPVAVREGGAPDGRQVGIPDPVAVDAPSEPWRSRMRGQVWEYNEGHPDHRAIADDPARRVRYLIHLFAKEVVLRNFGSPAEEALLERMVEVLTHLGDGRAR